MLTKMVIQDFLDERDMMNLSMETIKGYGIFFREVQEFLRENDILHIEDVTANTIRSYLMYCKNERGNAPSTINNKLKNLKALFNHAVENEYIDKNPCYKIKKQVTEEKIEVFTDAHIKAMMRYYRRLKRKDHEFTANRNMSIIVTLLGTGIRIGELRNLQWKDVSNNYILVNGKNRKQESVPLTKRVYDELMELKLYYSKYFNSEPVYVFCTRRGEQMSYEATKSIFQRLDNQLGFKDVRLSAHTFRHTFAQRFLMNGGDVFSLQKILRHKSLSMTEKYLALWGDALSEQNDKYNPLNGIDL